ncbi:hypothetical protein GF376_02520 [Candidatus Peregrinibacteria bacterium]|nr:hypothetical protein [Candidatus Peregrinibacteria bacterium]
MANDLDFDFDFESMDDLVVDFETIHLQHPVERLRRRSDTPPSRASLLVEGAEYFRFDDWEGLPKKVSNS